MLHFFRISKGVSEESLAQLNRVSIQTIRRWEKGLVALSPDRLIRVLAPLGIPPDAVETALLAHRLGSPSPEPGLIAAPSGEKQRLIRRASATVGRSGAEAARAELTRLCSVQEAPLHRRWANGIWARMKKLPEDKQALVAGAAALDERSWALAERICHASIEVAAHRADESLRLARLAVSIAEQTRHAERSRLRLLGWCGHFVANSLRVGGDLTASDAAFARADELWKQGERGDPSGILDATRRLDLKASLLRQRARFDEALELIHQALAGSPPEAEARLLLNKATTLARAGEYEKTIEVLRQAEPRIDSQRDPRLPFLHSFTLVSCLCRLERYGAAEELLSKVERLSKTLQNELDTVRTVWLKGQIAAGLGRQEEAVATLSRVREYFDRERIPYDFALATLELALLFLEQGRARRVRHLADEMLWIFQTQGVHKEALAAISLFCQAAKLESADAQWTRRLVKFLYRAQHNPSMRFEE